MDILTEVKKLATSKADIVTAWEMTSGNRYSDFDNLTQALVEYQIGSLDAKISELTVLEGANMPTSVKEILLNSIKNTASIIASTESLNASAFKDTSIVYLPTMEVKSTNVSACCKNCNMLICVEPLDFSSVKDCSEAFCGCTYLKKFLISDFSSVVKASRAFQQCSLITDLPFQDLSSLVDGAAMFANCINLKEFNISNLPKLNSGASMFAGCTSLKNLKLSLPNIINGGLMFYHCSSLESVELSCLSNLTSGSNMFSGCAKLSNVTLESSESIQQAQSMFSYCYSLTSISEIDGLSIINADYMFADCSSLPSVSFKDGSLVLAATFYATFSGCGNLQSITGLRLSGVCLDLSSETIKTDENYQRAKKINLPSSLTDCELQGTLYRSGFTLTNCPNLSAASLFSWIAALYDWETNEESKTTIDSDHTLYLTSEQLATLEEYEGDGTMTGAEVIEQALTYGWNLSE